MFVKEQRQNCPKLFFKREFFNQSLKNKNHAYFYLTRCYHLTTACHFHWPTHWNLSWAIFRSKFLLNKFSIQDLKKILHELNENHSKIIDHGTKVSRLYSFSHFIFLLSELTHFAVLYSIKFTQGYKLHNFPFSFSFFKKNRMK